MDVRPSKIDDGSDESHRRIQARRILSPEAQAVALERDDPSVIVTHPWTVLWPGALPCDDNLCHCSLARVETWPEALTIIRDRVNNLAALKETRP